MNDQIRFEKDFKSCKEIFQDTLVRNFHFELRAANGHQPYKLRSEEQLKDSRLY